MYFDPSVALTRIPKQEKPLVDSVIKFLSKSIIPNKEKKGMALDFTLDLKGRETMRRLSQRVGVDKMKALGSWINKLVVNEDRKDSRAARWEIEKKFIDLIPSLKFNSVLITGLYRKSSKSNDIFAAGGFTAKFNTDKGPIVVHLRNHGNWITGGKSIKREGCSSVTFELDGHSYKVSSNKPNNPLYKELNRYYSFVKENIGKSSKVRMAAKLEYSH